MRKLLLVLTIMILLFPPSAVAVAAPQAATSVQVTVTITRVVEIHCDEDFPLESCPNDYYPKFDIDAKNFYDGEEDYCCWESEDFTPNWTHSATVDSSHNPVLVHIELFDDDDGSEDDEIDISPDPETDDSLGKVVDVLFDLNTCVFKGLGENPRIPSFLLDGQSAGGGTESAQVFFSITTPFCNSSNPDFRNGDFDDDGLLNGWEYPGLGVDGDNDGTPDLVLADPPYNASPIHKDLFVEVDWMKDDTHSHRPVSNVLTVVINAFAAAPVKNIDGKDGITLHAAEDEAVPDVANILFETTGPGPMDDFDDIKLGTAAKACDGWFGTVADRGSTTNCAKILAAKKLVYRYMIFAHSHSEGPSSSGIAETGRQPDDSALGGNDFLVTLGAPFDAPCIAATGNPCVTASGRQEAEASTFMHEFGHTLGLLHGGDERFVNCKPNYRSIMNYTLQFPNYDQNRPMNYSSGTLRVLNENAALDETVGLGGPAGQLAVYGVGGNLRTDPADASNIDWNQMNGDKEKNATADINFISTIQPTSANGGCSTASPDQSLHDWDDWGNLKYNFRNSNDFADGARSPTDPELTGETLLAMMAQADLKIAKSVDKATAIGGDTLNYSVTVTNVGRGKAINVSLTDTLPDGSTQTLALPNLDTDASNTQTFTFPVACTAADGTVLTNHAFVIGTDESGIPDPDLSDNTAEASTTIKAPKLTLSKTATASVNAGEAITYSITYENTGSGAAANVIITDILPTGVYYSTALDLGAGPKPDTVTLNADGTRTLTWNVGSVSANSGPQTIIYTARPTLLALGGTSYSNSASLSFQNDNGCVYDTLKASASTSISVVPPTRDPLTLGFWRNHPELWTAEILARIQATDQRYDADGDGALSVAEARAMLSPGGDQPKVLQMQLLATYFNLSTRRINADTTISSKTADSLGLANVRDAAIFAMDTLLLPVQPNVAQYDDATRVIDEINNNKSELY